MTRPVDLGDQKLVFVLSPLRAGPDGPISGSFIIGLAPAAFVRSAFQGRDLSGLDYSLIDESLPQSEQVLYAKGGSSLRVGTQEAEWTMPVRFADRDWKFVCRATSLSGGSSMPWLLLCGGMLLTGALLIFLMNNLRYIHQIEEYAREVKQNHEELEQAHTDLKESHAKIIEAEKLKTAQNITHSLVRDLRQPLTSLLLAHHTAQEDEEGEEESRHARILSDAVSRLSEIVERLARHTRHEGEATIEEKITTDSAREMDPSPEEKSVLVIEDEEPIRELLTIIIEEMGYEVETAARGSEGLEKAQSGKFGLILTDIGLPDLSGIEIFIETRLLNRNQKFAFMSGYALRARSKITCRFNAKFCH